MRNSILALSGRMILGTVAALCLPCTPAAAQTAPPADERPPGQIRLGRLSLTPSVKLSHLGVDTNVFNSERERESDFTFTLTPAVEGLLDLGRLQIGGTGGADYLYFQRFQTERALNPRFGGRVSARIGRRSELFGQHSYGSIRDRINLEIDSRVQRLERAASAGASLGVTRRFKLDLSAGTQIVDFREGATFDGIDLRQTLSREERSLDASAQYVLTSLTTAVVAARIWEDRFPFLPSKNSRSTEAGVAVRFQPRALLAGRAGIGYLYSESRSGDVPSYNDVAAHIELTYTLLEATQFGVTFERGKEYSYDIRAPYYGFNRYGASVRRHLFGRVDITLEAAEQRRRYQRLLSLAEPAPDGRPDRARSFNARLGVRVARAATFGLDAEYIIHERRNAGRGRYDGLRIGLMASYGVFRVGDRLAPTQ